VRNKIRKHIYFALQTARKNKVLVNIANAERSVLWRDEFERIKEDTSSFLEIWNRVTFKRNCNKDNNKMKFIIIGSFLVNAI